VILGIGADLVRTGRLTGRGLKPDDPFWRRSFTAAERAGAESHPPGEAYLAGQWAAKEAVYKAISSSCRREFRPGDIEVLDGPDGRPSARLLGQTLAAMVRVLGEDGFKLHVSISWETGFAMGVALAETSDQ
jgi:holo-[acyl-carrier protein] synthase